MKKLYGILLFVICISIYSFSQTLTVSTDKITANAGDNILVPINVTNFVNVGAITIKMQYDQNVLQWNGATNWNAETTGGLANGVNGVATISWTMFDPTANGAVIKSGLLVNFKFIYKGGSTALTFLPNQSEITDSSGTIVYTVNYTDGSVSQLPPGVPTLSSPTNGSAGISVTPTLVWFKASGATSYNLQVSTNSSFTTPVINQTGLTDTLYNLAGLLNNTKYYWRVSSSNGSATSSWSGVWNFTTVQVQPGVPVLISPENNSVNQPTSITPTWHSVNGAESYRLQVATNASFTNIIVDNAGLTDTTKAVSGLSNNTKYYWHVSSTNGAGTSAYSDTWNFTTIVAKPVAPTLLSPANNSIDQLTNPTISWIASTGATSYRLQVSTDASFNTLIFNDSTITTTSKQILGLSNSTKYYWRVNAKNAGGTSSYSDIWNFTTEAPLVLTVSTGNITANAGDNIVVPINVTNFVNVGAITIKMQYDQNVLQWNGATNWNPAIPLGLANGSNGVATISWTMDPTANGANIKSGKLVDFNFKYKGGSTALTFLPQQSEITDSSGTIVYTVNYTDGSVSQLPPGIPTLSSPTNGSTSISITPTLVWFKASGASTYNLQVSTNSSFTTPVINQTGLTDTLYNATGLSNGTQYYWRVSTTNSAGTSNWSAAWSFTTIVAVPPVPVLLSPTNNSINQPTTLTLSWNTSPGAASYRLQVSAKEDFSSLIINDSTITSTSKQVAGLNNSTIYYWRVNAKNAGGASAYSTIWNFTTIVGAPQAPVLVQPANNATEVSTTPLLVWNKSNTAATYNLQVSTSSDFSTTVENKTGLADTIYNLTGLSNSTKYYWRVSAANAGGTSNWSSVWNFTTIMSVPSAPLLLSPSDNSINQPTTITLGWNPSTGASSYRLQISTDANFNSLFFNDSSIINTSRQISGLSNNVKYYWRVNAKNIAGTSVYSAVWNFTTIVSKPPTPVLALPVNNAAEVSITPELVWNKSNTAATYNLQVSTTADFATTVINRTGLTDTAFNATGLLNSTKYYWRLSATNPGGTSNWSTVWNFTTLIIIPPTPVLISPANNSQNQKVSLTFNWNSSLGAETYRLQVAKDLNFTQLVFNDSTIKTNSSIVNGLTNNTQYYWRVNAKDIKGTSSYSEVWNFTTVVAVPPVPTLLSPINNATGISTTPTFEWNASSTAASYNLQVSTSSTFSSFVINLTGITDTKYNATKLSNSTKYYWRVSATNAGGTSNWSSVWNFTTTITAPAVPTLFLPQNNSTGVSLTPTIKWNKSNDASSYNLQVSTSSTFQTNVVNQTSITDTIFNVTGLSNNTQYYWRVSATNSGGNSNWSTAWNFTTIVAAPPAPELLLPGNNAIDQPTTLTMSWKASSGAASYKLQISAKEDFSSLVINDSTITSTSKEVTGLLNSTKYYWRVYAKNVGGTSGYSSIWNFTTVILAPQAPILASPGNNETAISLTPRLAWNKSNTATTYNLQVSTSSTFATTVLNQTGLTDTTFNVTGLLNSTQYYWRVNAINKGGTSGWSKVFNFTTIVAPPSSTLLKSPLNEDKNINVNPTLSWFSVQSASKYSLQVSTVSNFASTIINQNDITDSSYSVKGLSNNTKYYWRVRAINDGGTGGWSDVWNFTTIVSSPTTPGLVYPGNGSTGIPIIVEVKWDSLSGAISYGLQVSTSSTFVTTIVNQTGITGTSYNVSGLSNNVKYYWRVNAVNAAGTSDWSDAWSFTTIIASPLSPVLVTPLNGASNVALTEKLVWKKSLAAVSYTLQVSTKSSFDSLVIDETGITDSLYTLSGLSNNKQYYWRVRAVNLGGASDWSVAYSFLTTGNTPALPVLLAPLDNANNLSIYQKLKWKPDSNATSYHLQVSIDQKFSSLAVDQPGLLTTSYNVSGLQYNTTYYWRLIAGNVSGTSNWSSVWEFKTMELPKLTIGSQSANSGDTILVPLTAENFYGIGAITLKLRFNDTVLKYISSINRNSMINDALINLTGNSLIISWSGISSLNISDAKLLDLKFIYKGSAADITFTNTDCEVADTAGHVLSAIYNKGTVNSNPVAAAPVLISPAIGTTGITINPNLTWNAIAAAASYRVQVSTSSTFGTNVIDSIGITSTGIGLTGLSHNLIYYWRVKAQNAISESDWSSIWNFTTIEAVPTVPTLIYPANGAKGIDLEVTLKWDTLSGAVSFNLQVSSDSNFKSLITNQTGITGTSYTISSLQNNVKYYWRVSAKNSTGNSNWSSQWMFTTKPVVVFYDLSGRIDYQNYSNTPLSKVSVSLTNKSDGSSLNTLSNTLGVYKFSNLLPGDYQISVSSSGNWGGANSADALMLLHYFGEKGTLEPLEFLAGDVNNNNDVSSTDAMMIMQRYVGKISIFPNGKSDWNFIRNDSLSDSVIISNSDRTINFESLCSGDVNKSYVPTGIEKENSIIQDNSIKVPVHAKEEFSIPVAFSSDEKLGAISLRLKYPTGLAEFVGIEANNSIKDYISNEENGMISIAWIDFTGGSNPALIKGGTPLFTFKFKANDTFGPNEKFSLTIEPETEFADFDCNIISGLQMIIPVGEICIPTEFTLEQNYPNPFNPSTTISYSLPEDSKVVITIYNVLGKEIEKLVNGMNQAGDHKITWQASNLPSGIYICKLYAQSKSRSFSQIKKMILLK